MGAWVMINADWYNLRSVTFERHIIVGYRVENRTVRILRLIDTSRDFRRAFSGTTG